MCSGYLVLTPRVCPTCSLLPNTPAAMTSWFIKHGPQFYFVCKFCGVAMTVIRPTWGIRLLGPVFPHTFRRFTFRMWRCVEPSLECRCVFSVAERTHQAYWRMIASCRFPRALGRQVTTRYLSFETLWAATAAQLSNIPVQKPPLTPHVDRGVRRIEDPASDLGSISDEDAFASAQKRSSRFVVPVHCCPRCRGTFVICIDDFSHNRAQEHLCGDCGHAFDNAAAPVAGPSVTVSKCFLLTPDGSFQAVWTPPTGRQSSSSAASARSHNGMKIKTHTNPNLSSRLLRH